MKMVLVLFELDVHQQGDLANNSKRGIYIWLEDIKKAVSKRKKSKESSYARRRCWRLPGLLCQRYSSDDRIGFTAVAWRTHLHRCPMPLHHQPITIPIIHSPWQSSLGTHPGTIPLPFISTFHYLSLYFIMEFSRFCSFPICHHNAL